MIVERLRSAERLHVVLVGLCAATIVLWVLTGWLPLGDGVVVEGRDAYTRRIGLADHQLNAWILDWSLRHVAAGRDALFDAGIFHPDRRSLALSEHLLGTLPVYGPLRALSGDPVQAYDLFVAAAFGLAAAAFYHLARSHGLARSGALLGAIVFSFGPARVGRLLEGQTQLLGLFWLPWVLVLARSHLRSGGVLSLAAFCALLCLQILSSFYLAYFALAALVLYLAVAWLREGGDARGRIAGLLAASVVAAAAPLYYSQPYLELREAGVLSDNVEQQASILELHSADATRSYTTCLPSTGAHGHLYSGWLRCPPFRAPPSFLFMGFVALALGLIGATRGLRRLPPGDASALAWAALLWLLAGYVLSLGPRLVVGGHPQPWADGFMPYRWLAAIVPGFESQRAPARWGQLVSFGLAVLAAVGLTTSLQAISRPALARMLAVLALFLVLLEHRVGPLRQEPLLPSESGFEAHRFLREHRPGAALLELPVGAGPWDRAPRYVLGSTIHRHPLVNGYSGYLPPAHHRRMTLARRLPSPPPTQALAGLGVRLVLVHEADPLLMPRHLEPAMRRGGLRVVRRFGDDVLYELPGATP